MKARAAAVSTLTATAIVVADMIGVGVFTSLGSQVTDITSGFMRLLLWFVGGGVALCGAFCWPEIATMFPRSSGEYNFLTRMYGLAFGFMAGRLSATVGFAAPVAFGQQAKAVLPGAPPLLLGFAVIWIVTAVHLSGTRHGSVLQAGSTLLKLARIVAFTPPIFLSVTLLMLAGFLLHVLAKQWGPEGTRPTSLT